MTAPKGIHIRDIREGQNIDGIFLVKAMSRAETRTGSPYLILTVMDASGEISGRVWDEADRLMAEAPTGGIVRLRGQAQAFKGNLQLKITDLKALPAEAIDIAELLPATAADPKEMAAELKRLIKTVENHFLRELLQAFFGKRAFLGAFKKAPAAKGIHHAYIGGLIEHTLAVARLVDAICPLYPTIDRDLLLTGAILHDIGKVIEFSFEVYPFNYTDQGRLVGHLVLGVEMIQERVNAIDHFPAELATRLKHLVLSHHGRHEFGSPTVPMMVEAIVLNFLDDLDAKLNYVNRLSEQLPGEGYQWSDYQRPLERFLYLAGRGGQAAESPPADDDEPPVDPRQKNLWE